MTPPIGRGMRETIREAQAIVRMVAEAPHDPEDAQTMALGGAITLLSFVLLLTEKDNL